MREGWKQVKLGEVCLKITDGSHYSPKTTERGYPYITVKDIVNYDGDIDFRNCKFIDKTAFEDLVRNGCKPEFGDVLFSKDGTVGKVSLVNYKRDFVVLSSLAIVRPNPELINSRFLKYVFLSSFFLNEAIGKKTGVAIRRIILKNLKPILVPLPPLPDQQSIVELLDNAFERIDQAIADTEQNLRNTRELFESYLNTIFTQKGPDWEEKKLGEIAECCLGKMLDKQKNKGSLQKYLRNKNIRWFEIDTNDLLEMKFEESEFERFSVAKGDLLICEGGYPGRAAIWKEEYPIYFQKAVHRVRLKNPIFNKWLMYHLFLMDSTGDLKTHFTGAGIQHFTGRQLKNYRIPVPAEEEVQFHCCQIEKFHSKTQQLETLYTQKLEALKELKQSLLQKAFSGELTQ